MTEQDRAPHPQGVNRDFAAFQLARALRTGTPQTVARWEAVMQNILGGRADYGTRTPLHGIPAWATLEVATGGFATGALLAAGSLQEHELALLARLPACSAGAERLSLNAWFLSDAGLACLHDWLRTGCYDIHVPEEGALLVMAWLLEHGEADAARALLNDIAPFFARLRFYPAPRPTPPRTGARVHCQDVQHTRAALDDIAPNRHIVAQQRAVDTWLPLYDRMVALFLETVQDSWPCRLYPDGWRARAIALLTEYDTLSSQHPPGRKFAHPNAHRAQLRTLLARCADDPASLSGREVGRLRLILRCYLDKRGAPLAPASLQARSQQVADVSAPPFYAIARIVSTRLADYPGDDGVDDVVPLTGAVSAAEAAVTGVPCGTGVPPSIRAKVNRCVNDTVDGLIARGLIASGEVLANVLPQMTSGINAAGIADPSLRKLYASLYRAFRRRRSLLLLNLDTQVRMVDLPWVRAIDRFQSDDAARQALARQTLQEIAAAALTAFPQAILPNKFIQELAALVRSAGATLPLVEELAADIFMGEFSDKFVAAAQVAANLLDGSLYALYFAIDYAAMRGAAPAPEAPVRWWARRPPAPVAFTTAAFAELCATRAGVPRGTWKTANNGMIIEQQQILTTQNLAALFAGLDLASTLAPQLHKMAMRCFQWSCLRLQTTTGDRHANLIAIKNAAYAWRQMIFFLALLPPAGLKQFIDEARTHFATTPDAFRQRFAPAVEGLILAAAGVSPDSNAALAAGARRFTGWSSMPHWLMPSGDVVGPPPRS